MVDKEEKNKKSKLGKLLNKETSDRSYSLAGNSIQFERSKSGLK